MVLLLAATTDAPNETDTTFQARGKPQPIRADAHRSAETTLPGPHRPLAESNGKFARQESEGNAD